MAGKLAAGASSWVPASYVASQQDAVKRFFQQNGYIGYDTVRGGCRTAGRWAWSCSAGRTGSLRGCGPGLPGTLSRRLDRRRSPALNIGRPPLLRPPSLLQAKQYGIPGPSQFLAQHFPDGVALDSAFVSPAVVDQVCGWVGAAHRTRLR